MRWQEHYDRLITRAKTRTLNTYTEKHHIVPKCMGGSNSKENLVSLTPKEHYIAHLLLCNLFPENDKLFFALWAMCNQDRTGDRHVPSSRTYNRAKEAFIARKQKKVQFRCSFCGKENMRIESHIRPERNYCNRTCYLSAETSGQSLSKNRVHIFKGNQSKFIRSSELSNYPDWTLGRKNISKKLIQIDPVTLREVQTFLKVGDVRKAGFNPTGVSKCVNGHTKTHKGFFWKFKNDLLN